MLQGPPPPPVAGGLADLLGGAGGGPPPGPPGLPLGLDNEGANDAGTDDSSKDPLAELQDAVGTLHTLMQTLPDPADVDAIAQALKILTGVQKRQMTSGPGQAPASGQ
jgi:hypothetical protein